MKLIATLLAFCLLLCSVSSVVVAPPNIQGTILPSLTYITPARVFNDLMKQSYPLVPYQFIWGGISRYWGYNLTLINGLAHQYPTSLATNVYAVAEIKLYAGIDDGLLNKDFTLTFSGAGVVGATQSGLFNLTWGSGSGGQFTLKALNQSLFIYIYSTTAANPVSNIQIFPIALGANPPTYTDNFLKYLKPFNKLRTCYWQGQNLFNSGYSSQIWANRTLKTSTTQVSSTGVALEHILELETAASATIWPCIPDTAVSDYVAKMAQLFASTRDQTQTLHIEYGHVYTIMNNFPDAVTTPVFDNFMQNYGPTYRSKVVFTINYKDIQYYINAMGMRTSPPINFTYIDAIGFDSSFGIIDAVEGFPLNDADLKKLIIHYELKYETTVNRAYQLAKRNGTDMVMWSGGPNLKTLQYGYIWKNSTNSSYATLADQEDKLNKRLYAMTLTDPWVGELYLQWKARMSSIGINVFVFTQLYGPFTNARDIVPLIPYLNTTTPAFLALNDSFYNNRQTTLPTYGVVPSNPHVCTPSCKWGDCVFNVCACYAGYSGSDCSIYTAPNVQNKVGINLQGVVYWSTQHPFLDLHRQGSGWVYFITNQGWSSGNAYASQVTFDDDNYPTYLPYGIQVGTLMARDILTHYDKGTYVILYDGDGTLTFGMFDVIAVRYGIGRIEVDVVPSTNFNNGLLVTIERTNPNNHVRNIRVIRPGFEAIWQAVNFSPLFLEKIEPYGTIRYMDWMDTNDQKDTEWSTRTKTTRRAYTENGVAWEETIRLANTLGKNVWINIPHLASDDYIQKLAQLFFDTLEPHLNVYVEYSNEVWGTLFPGGQYAQAQGILKGYAPTDPTQARFCFLGQRTNEISTIWKGVWGAANARLNVILSTQAVNADTTRRILKCRSSQNYVQGIAIAPYLSIALKDTMSFNDIFTGLYAQITKIGTMIQTHLVYTNNYSLPLHCYESGQGLTGSTSTQTNLQIGVQTADTMTDIYLKYHEMLFNNSIGVANQFTDSGLYSGYGSWGLFQYTDERLTASKKWIGLNTYFTEQGLNTGVQLYGACPKNCNGNGICYFGTCSCYSDYSGSDCSVGKFIDFVDCSYLCTFNQGTCGLTGTVGINRYFACTCLPGYGGFYCSLPVCSNNCNYAGTCTAPGTCTCFRGRFGPTCASDCGCNGHGTCAADNATCVCDAGFTFNTTSKKCEFSCLGQVSANCYGPDLLKCASCVSGSCNNGTCDCWPGFSGSDCSVEVPVQYVNDNLGINVGGLAYWSTQHLFKDYFKQSSQWIAQYLPGYFPSNITYTWNTGESFPVRPDGYPSSLAANQSVVKLLLRDLSLRYPSIATTNKYILFYDGEGFIDLGFDAKATEVSPGRIKFTVTPSTVRDNGVFVRLQKTNPANPVRNIRVILAQDEYNYEKDLLTAPFLRFISQFSTIRYMDLMGTNGNPVSEWNQTTRIDADSQAKQTGISIELVAKITSRTGRNLWFNVPHQASDDYVTKLATYFKTALPANRLIYVEYSNEVWNTFFAQGQYATLKANQSGLTNYHKFYAKRSLEIFNIFSTVFGTGSARLKFVISYQAVSKWVADQILTYPGLSSVVNIVAGAPYYDCNNIGNNTNVAVIATQTPADVITRCMAQANFDTLTAILSVENQVSSAYNNLPMATYEAGTSISEQNTIYTGGDTPAATVNFIAANRDPGMYDVYKKLLYTYKTNNFTKNAPTMLFSSIGLPSKYGSWGVLDYLDQVLETPTHPKFQAILDFNQNL